MSKKKGKDRDHKNRGHKNRGHKNRGQGDLYDPQQVASGKQLMHLAKALTKLEIRPQRTAARGLINELKGLGAANQVGLGRLGQRTTRNVSSTYRNLARSEAENIARQSAIGNQLQQRTAQIGVQGAQEAKTQVQGQVGSYLEGLQARSAPGQGAAQQQLANMVASQQQAQAANTQAQQGFAASQAAGYQQFASAAAESAQRQGASAQRDIQREVAGRRAEDRLSSGQNIREALGKLSDIRALRGPTTLKNLAQLTKDEREFILGRAAVKSDKAQLSEDIRHNKAGERETKRSHRADERTAEENAQISAWKAKHPNYDDRAFELWKKRHGIGDSGSGSSKGERRHDVRNIKATARQAVPGEFKFWPQKPYQLDQLIEYVNTKVDADPALVEKVIRRMAKKRKKRRGGSQGPSF